MAKKKESRTVPKLSSQESFQLLSNAFYEASKISFSLVFFPIVILLAAIWLDKKLSTTPLFIILGIIIGVLTGVYKATRIKKPGSIKNG